MPTRSRKRPFKRGGGLLRDAYRGVDGKKIGFMMPSSMVGEPVPAAERAVRRAEIGGDDSLKASRAMDALSDEHSPEMLEQLLVAIAKRNIGAPGRLTSYVEDPRVQPALLDAVRTVPLEDVANFAQALGIVGGPGARDALRARMQEALSDPQTFAPDPFFNSRAGAAMTCAKQLLYLDPEDQDAADTLVRLTGHICGFNRRNATWHAAEMLARHKGLRTRPLRALRAALTALIETPDDEVFCVAAPALWQDVRVPARVSLLLESKNVTKQKLALGPLCKLEWRGWPLLVKWASRPRDPILVLTTLGPHLHLLPEARRAEVVQRGLANPAPYIRHDAASVLASLDKVVAAKLARHALKDEPDPAVKAKLATYVGGPARRAKRRRR